MKNRKHSFSATLVVVTALLPPAGGLALAAPLTPELAAKREMVRQQQEQRVTPAERKTAVDWLKAERLKIYNARQAALKSNPGQNK